MKFLFFLILILISNLINCDDYTIGNIPYSIDVDQGILKLNVPLDIPDRVNDYQANLALQYSSDNLFNSFIGLGWSLAGLSSINLCSSSKYSYQLDEICWDGKILKETTQGLYVAEIDDYSRIQAIKDTSNLTDMFIINTKANKILKFGGSEYSKVFLSKNKIYQWLLTDIENSFGRIISFSYQNTTRFPYLKTIKYGNTVIQFYYVSRNDLSVNYYKGQFMYNIDLLLSNITIFISDDLYTSYKFNYATLKNKSVLKEIYYCGRDNVCLKPLKFNYTNEMDKNIDFSALRNWDTSCFNYQDLAARSIVDMNGDGLGDLTGITNKEFLVFLSTGNNFESSTVWLTMGFSNLDFTNDISRLVDLNGDGLVDFALIGPDGLYVALNSNGKSMGALTKWSSSFGSNDLWGHNIMYYYQDVNGDNLADMVAFQRDGVFVSINQKSTFMPKNLWNNQFIKTQTVYYNVKVDINLDGLVDLIGVVNGLILIAINNGTGFVKTEYYNTYRDNRYSISNIQIIDLNNDFLPDIVRIYNNHFYVALNNGTGFNDEKLLNPSFSISNSPFYFLDINKDDYIDLVWIDFTTNKILASFNNKVGFESTINEITKLPSSIKYFINNFEFVDLFSNNTLSILAFSSCGILTTTHLTNNQELSIIKNSFDEPNIINYDYLTNASIYESTKLTSYPYMSKYFSKRVVTSLKVPSGIKNTPNITYFKYKDLILDLSKPGVFSFSSINSTYSSSKISTQKDYFTDFPLTGQIKSCSLFIKNNLIYRSRVDYSTTQSMFCSECLTINPKSSEEVFFELNGNLIKSILNNFSAIDSFGNIGEIYEKFSDGKNDYERITVNTYVVNTTSWFINNIHATKVIYDGNSCFKRNILFEFDQKTRLLKNKIIQPDDDKYSRIENYKYDQYGNLISLIKAPYKDTSDPNNKQRKETWKFVLNGLYMMLHCNALNQCESFNYNKYGNKISEISPNNLQTNYTYDMFGRKIQENRYDQLKIEWKYSFDTTMQNGYYKIAKYVNNKIRSYEIFDTLNRVIRSAEMAYNGEFSLVDYEYDIMGYIVKKSLPYFEKSNKISNVKLEYDFLGRKTLERIPLDLDKESFTEIKTTYKGLTTLVERNGFTHKIYEYDFIGNMKAVTDSLNSRMSYSYDNYGNLEKIIDSVGNKIEMKYNSVGDKIEIINPSVGRVRMEYNVFNELTKQIDNKGQVTYFNVDQLGRIISRRENEGQTVWTYDKASNGIGKLQKVEMASSAYSRVYEYDEKGREKQITYSIDREIYSIINEYNSFNQIISQNYSGKFSYYWCYNSYNFLKAISSTDPNCYAVGSNLWNAIEYDANGNILHEIYENNFENFYIYDDAYRLSSEFTAVFKNTNKNKVNQLVRKHNYKYDKMNNLIERETFFGSNFHKKETYRYDPLDRLNYVTYSNINTNYYTYLEYDEIGNIKSNSDISQNYVYDSNKPFQLLTAGTHKYSYDENGNVVKRDDQIITWTSYNMPIRFQTKEANLSYTYGPDREKIKRIDPNGDVTIYIGQYYEKIKRKLNKDTIDKYSVILKNRILSRTIRNSNNEQETFFFNTDFAGSIDTISLENSNVLYYYNYRVFGQLNFIYSEDSKLDLQCLFNRGFTNHEHIGDSNLIHMNGRVFDSTIAKFLSADPFIQDLFNMQSLNSYAYSFNNPFKYSDPTGHFFQFFFFITGALVQAAISHAVTPVIASFAASIFGMSRVASVVFSNALLGGLTGLIASHGSIKSGLGGLMFGTIMGGIDIKFGGTFTPNRILFESLAGGFSNKLQGGSFFDGLVKSSIASTARFLYNNAFPLNEDPTGLPGKKVPPHMRKGPDGDPLYGYNNIGEQTNSNSILYEGRFISNILNAIPGINDIAFLHDQLQIRWNSFLNWKSIEARTILNVPSMIPCTLVAYEALLSGPQVYATFSKTKDQR